MPEAHRQRRVFALAFMGLSHRNGGRYGRRLLLRWRRWWRRRNRRRDLRNRRRYRLSRHIDVRRRDEWWRRLLHLRRRRWWGLRQIRRLFLNHLGLDLLAAFL